MRLILVPLFSFYIFLAGAQPGLQPIGSWREYLPYHSAVDVTTSTKKIYCATPFSLFSVDIITNEINRISKISGLSETGISTIKFDAASDKLFIAYTNSNIDVVDAKKINNIPDLKRENIAGDKTIYHIYPQNNLCYLSTGIGVIIIDVEKYEVKDSWFIGNGGSQVKVNMFTADNTFFYAATEDGLKKTPVNTYNPADYNAWENLSGVNGLPAGRCKGVINLQNDIVALINDSVFVQMGNSWRLLFANGWPITSINSSEDKLLICQRTASGDSKVVVVNANGSIVKNIQQPEVISFPKSAIVHNGEYWIADLYGGLSHWYGNEFEQYKLNSPEDIATGEMLVYNNTLYAAAGSVNSAWNYQYNSAGIYKFENGQWTNYNRFKFKQLDSLLDFITVAVDKR
ncbi:MAG: hypothetical protein ICV66_08625, partial [Chitinophagaceae bacterium]|nr:hypothetical protein [Chitinophagaceae bacterium]